MWTVDLAYGYAVNDHMSAVYKGGQKTAPPKDALVITYLAVVDGEPSASELVTVPVGRTELARGTATGPPPSIEVEHVVETGELLPDDIHLPGIYVHRIVHNPNPEKRIEKRTLSQ